MEGKGILLTLYDWYDMMYNDRTTLAPNKSKLMKHWQNILLLFRHEAHEVRSGMRGLKVSPQHTNRNLITARTQLQQFVNNRQHAGHSEGQVG